MVWLLPGMFWHYDLYKRIIGKIKSAIFYDGLNSCSWNGGRKNVLGNDLRRSVLNEYYKYGHRIALTFSNEHIDDLSDRVGNYLLDSISDRENYVILRNSKLKDYIRNRYMNLKLIYSITGTEEEYRKEFYEDVLSEYDYVVPRYHHIEKIASDFSGLERFEIIINHTCFSRCPFWRKHYSIIDKENRMGSSSSNYDSEEITCLIDEKITDSSIFSDIIRKRFIKASSLGFKRFKLSGREFSKKRLEKEISSIKDLL